MGKNEPIMSKTTTLLSFFLLNCLVNVQSLFDSLPVGVLGQVPSHVDSSAIPNVYTVTGGTDTLSIQQPDAASLLASSCKNIHPGQIDKQQQCIKTITEKTGIMELANVSPKLMSVFRSTPLSKLVDLEEIAQLPLNDGLIHDLVNSFTKLMGVEKMAVQEQILLIVQLNNVQQKIAEEVILLDDIPSNKKAAILLTNSLMKIPDILTPRQISSFAQDIVSRHMFVPYQIARANGMPPL